MLSTQKIVHPCLDVTVAIDMAYLPIRVFNKMQQQEAL